MSSTSNEIEIEVDFEFDMDGKVVYITLHSTHQLTGEDIKTAVCEYIDFRTKEAQSPVEDPDSGGLLN